MTSIKRCPCIHCEQSRQMIETRIDWLYALAFIALIVCMVVSLGTATP